MNRKGLVYILLSITMLFWGLSFIWYKQALIHVGPVTLIFFRLVVASVALWTYLFLTGRAQKIKLEDVWLFAGLAFFEPFLYFLGESIGIQYVSSSLAAIIIATIPLFTPFTSYIFFREKLTVKNYIGLVVSFFGVLLVILNDSNSYDFSFKGIALMMLAVFSTQGYLVLLSKLSGKYRTANIVAVQNSLGVIFFLPVFLIFESGRFHFENLVIAWRPLIYLALLGSMVAFLFFTWGVKAIGISKANVFANFIPVFTAISAFFVLSETLPMQKTLGIILAIFGVILTQLKQKTIIDSNELHTEIDTKI